MNLSTFVRDGLLKRKRDSLKRRHFKKRKLTYTIVRPEGERCTAVEEEVSAEVLRDISTNSKKMVQPMTAEQSDSEVVDITKTSSSSDSDCSWTKPSVNHELKKTSEYSFNENLLNYLVHFDEEKQRLYLNKIYRQSCYFTKGDKSLAHIMMRQIKANCFVRLERLKPLPPFEKKLSPLKIRIRKNKIKEQKIEGKMIELFGKEYLMSDQDILTNKFTSYNSTVPENENHTFCRINSVFSLKDELSNERNSNVSDKIIKNKPNTNSKKTRMILHLKKKFFSIVDPENDIFKNTIINDMVLYLLNDNFLFNFDCNWGTAECELIKELVIKLINTLNNTQNNILYLSSCFIMVFCKMADTIEPNELTRAFILFINALKKYVKYVDCELWKKWFIPNNFVSWCFVLYTLFMNGDKELAIVFEKSVIKDAKEYFKRAKRNKYEIKKNTKVKSGIFELTSSEDISNEMLTSVNTEKVSKNTADASPIKSITPQISVCSEFNVLNSFKTDMISHLLVSSKAGHNDYPATVNTIKSSNVDENEFPGLTVKNMCAQQEELDVRSKQQLTHNLDVSSVSVQETLVENCYNANKATQSINQQPLTSNVFQNQFKTTINTNTSSSTTTLKNDKINKQAKQHSTKVVCNKTNISTSMKNQMWTPESTQISISAQNQFMKTKRPSIEQCQSSNSKRTKQSKHCSKNAMSKKTSINYKFTNINFPQCSTNVQTPTNAQNHLPIARNTWPSTSVQSWPSNGNMNKLEKTQFSTNTVCNKQNRTCVPSQSENTVDNFIIENNEQSQYLNMTTQNNQFVTNQVCNNNEPPIYEQSRTSTSANTWFQSSAQNQPSNVSMHLQNNQFVQNQVCKNSRRPVNKQNLTLIPTNTRLPSNKQSQPSYDNMIMDTNQFAKNQVCNINRLPINEQNLSSISTDTRFQTNTQSQSSNDGMIMHSNHFKTNQMSNQIIKHVPLIPNYMQSSISEQRLHSNDLNKNHFTDTNNAQFDILTSSTQNNNQCQPLSGINVHSSSLGTIPSANYTRMNQYDTFTNNNPSIINNINVTLQSNTINANTSNIEWNESFYATSYSQPKSYYSHQNTLIQGLCCNNPASTTSSSGYLPPKSPRGGVVPNITPSKSVTMNSLPFEKNENYTSKNNMHNSYEPPSHYDQVSPDLPDTKVPNMPNQWNFMCMASNCKNKGSIACCSCVNAYYCSRKCKIDDHYYHFNECTRR